MADIRPIPFAPGYFVSDDGHVFSENGKGGGRREIKTSPGGAYKQFSAYVNRRQLTVNVHVAVCHAFHGPPPSGHEVRHLNGHPTDNRADNLAWGTRKQNMADKRAHGTWQIGERNGTSKLTEADARAIKTMLAAGGNQTEIATKYGITPANISSIATGATWAHIDVGDMSNRVKRRGDGHMSAKLAAEDVIFIRRAYAAGAKQPALAQKFGITQANVSMIVKRQTWKHVVDRDESGHTGTVLVNGE